MDGSKQKRSPFYLGRVGPLAVVLTLTLVPFGAFAETSQNAGEARDEAASLFGSVAATDYEVVESSVDCHGQYTTKTSGKTKSSGWNLLIFWTKSSEVETETKIDWQYECEATVQSRVYGYDGISRLVGVRAPASYSGPLGVKSSGEPVADLLHACRLVGSECTARLHDDVPLSDVPVSFGWKQELSQHCRYMVGGCSFAVQEAVSGGGMELNAKTYPQKTCGKVKAFEAFNRQDAAGASIDFVEGIVESKHQVNPPKEGICIPIQWEKVDSLDALETFSSFPLFQ